MKFTQIATLATIAQSALAAIHNVKLQFSSDNKEVDGKFLHSRHEGAAINYFFLGNGGEGLAYDDEKKSLFAGKGDMEVGIIDKFVSLAVTGSEEVEIDEDGVVSIGGKTEFAAGMNAGDPYNFSDNVYAVLTSGDIKGKIVVAGPAPSPSSSGYDNSTKTADEESTTVITYTQMSETVVTITECEETVTDCPARSSPITTKTVVPVTLTTTYCPATETPDFSSTITASTSTASPSSANPDITTAENGAAKVYGGAAAGVAAIAALVL